MINQRGSSWGAIINNLERESLVQERLSAAVILVIWPRFKTRGICNRGKKGYLSASVLNLGISHHYCLGSESNRGIICIKN